MSLEYCRILRRGESVVYWIMFLKRKVFVVVVVIKEENDGILEVKK